MMLLVEKNLKEFAVKKSRKKKAATGKGYENCFLFLIWAIFKNKRETRKHRTVDICSKEGLVQERGSGARVQGLVIDTSSTVTKWKGE